MTLLALTASVHGARLRLRLRLFGLETLWSDGVTGAAALQRPAGGPVIPQKSYEPMPELEFGPSAAPTDELDASATPEVSESPEIGREYPCRAGFTLEKMYKTYPKFKYYCIRPDRIDALVGPADCGNNFYLAQNGQCIKISPACEFFPRPPACFKQACPEGTAVVIRKVRNCVVCPRAYETYLDRGVYKCYKLLRTKPKCPPGQTFQKDTGVCEMKWNKLLLFSKIYPSTNAVLLFFIFFLWKLN